MNRFHRGTVLYCRCTIVLAVCPSIVRMKERLHPRGATDDTMIPLENDRLVQLPCELKTFMGLLSRAEMTPIQQSVNASSQWSRRICRARRLATDRYFPIQFCCRECMWRFVCESHGVVYACMRGYIIVSSKNYCTNQNVLWLIIEVVL